MASAPEGGEQENSEPLKYKTWVLKVSIHCEGCKRKVKRILHSIEGVYTIDVDARQHKSYGLIFTKRTPRKMKNKINNNNKINPKTKIKIQIEKQKVSFSVEEQQKEPQKAADNSGQQQQQVKEKKKKKKKGNNGNNNNNNNGGGGGNNNGGNGEVGGVEHGGNGGQQSSEPHPPQPPQQNPNPGQHPGSNPGPECMSPPRYPLNNRVYEYPPAYYAPPPVYAVNYNTAYPSSSYSASYYSAPRLIPTRMCIMEVTWSPLCRWIGTRMQFHRRIRSRCLVMKTQMHARLCNGKSIQLV
ncbi:Heavy metal-associated isoprenylated plant protein 35 [Bienertia sinuspersici]